MKLLVAIILSAWSVYTWIFAAYMITEYVIHPYGPWAQLPNLCCEPVQRIPFYIHVFGSVIMLLIGPFQLTNLVYKNCVHPWSGVIYFAGALMASIGGIIFIVLNGTVGGLSMSIPFAIYGMLVLIFAITTVCLACTKEYALHRDWAIRTYFMGSASVFYRVLYSIMCATIRCHSINFHAPVDYAFNWLFFLIPAVIVELALFIYHRTNHNDADMTPLTSSSSNLTTVVELSSSS